MIAQIITENGTKKLKPLTADAGAGAPVGTIIVVCSNRVPSNYLPLGTQFDTTQYPLLYAELGTDTTPTASSLNLPTLSSGQYVIKATSGLTEGQQDDVANIINGERSYSTSEINTGKKWIDGKPIYRKVYTGLDITLTQGSWCTLATGLTYIETLTDLRCFAVDSGTALTPFFMYSSYINSSGALAILPERTWNAKTFIIEYTKTT